jgi:hypothetical protein
MRNAERSLVALLLGVFLAVAGCGSSSTDSEVVEEVAVAAPVSSTVTCSQSSLCSGTYTTNVVAGAGLLNGPCQVNYVDASDVVTIVFEKGDTCDFSKVVASGDVGSAWAALASVNTDGFLVHHKGIDVYLLRTNVD